MTTLRQDPLLGIGRAILTVLMGLTIAICAVLAAIIPVVIANQDRLVRDMVKATSSAPGGDVIGGILGVLVLVAAMAALTFVLLRHLRRIVDTVRQGDPFIPENAARLRSMAWLSIVLQGVALVAGGLTMWLEEVSNKFEANFDLSIGGFLFPLVLFILARVFRRGAEMREELEGTV